MTTGSLRLTPISLKSSYMPPSQVFSIFHSRSLNIILALAHVLSAVANISFFEGPLRFSFNQFETINKHVTDTLYDF